MYEELLRLLLIAGNGSFPDGKYASTDQRYQAARLALLEVIALGMRAQERLKDEIQPDGGLYNGGWYVAWTPGEEKATLDAEFSADDLEAIAWWMRHGHTVASHRATMSSDRSK